MDMMKMVVDALRSGGGGPAALAGQSYKDYYAQTIAEGGEPVPPEVWMQQQQPQGMPPQQGMAPQGIPPQQGGIPM